MKNEHILSEICLKMSHGKCVVSMSVWKRNSPSIMNYITCYNYIKVSKLLAVRSHDGYRLQKQQHQKIVQKSTLGAKCACSFSR